MSSIDIGDTKTFLPGNKVNPKSTILGIILIAFFNPALKKQVDSSETI